MKINTKSIMFKAAVVYIFVTLLNVTVFNVMVWENQTGLIMDNAILNSQHKGSTIKYRIDDIVRSSEELSSNSINKIIKNASELQINDISLFQENGTVLSSVVGGKKVNKSDASAELRMINMAITKQGFEDKLFYHKVDKKNKKIALYIPFNYEADKIAVAAIDLEMQDINQQMGYLYRQCILIGILIIGIHIAFAIVFSKMLLIPLRHIIDATGKISRGDLSIRVPIVGQDELGLLASSFNEMSVALNRMRDEAKGANPLTGLPGNITIARYIDDALKAGRGICVLYCDLDNFKAYNDKYGFTKGDDAILYTRDCLNTVAKRNDVHDVFVGHEGGDDFVVITPFDCWEIYSKAFITTFDRGIYQFYNSQDARNGFIESVNRQGQRQRFPLMSISIAVVTNQTRPFNRHAEMIQIAAEVKKYVKGIDGSCYALDRRTGSVTQSRDANQRGQAPQVQQAQPQRPQTSMQGQQAPGQTRQTSVQQQQGTGIQQMPLQQVPAQQQVPRGTGAYNTGQPQQPQRPATGTYSPEQLQQQPQNPRGTGAYPQQQQQTQQPQNPPVGDTNTYNQQQFQQNQNSQRPDNPSEGGK